MDVAAAPTGGLDTATFLAVLAAALMHAGWNAIVKLGLDRFSSMELIALASMGLALALIPLLPLPSAAAWPWVVGSGLLHTGYKLCLIRAYAHGDLSQVHPVTRGTAPLIVCALGFVLLGETAGPPAAIGIALIGSGVVAISVPGGGRVADRMAVLWALGTARFTASYTLADAVGARLAGTASGFVMWIFVVDGIAMTAFAAFTRAPVGVVAALREASVLPAMLIGVLLLRERGGRWRWGAAASIAGGMLRL
jgi:drug/metabolite transporter (DMT)-like permease